MNGRTQRRNTKGTSHQGTRKTIQGKELVSLINHAQWDEHKRTTITNKKGRGVV